MTKAVIVNLGACIVILTMQYFLDLNQALIFVAGINAGTALFLIFDGIESQKKNEHLKGKKTGEDSTLGNWKKIVVALFGKDSAPANFIQKNP